MMSHSVEEISNVTWKLLFAYGFQVRTCAHPSMAVLAVPFWIHEEFVNDMVSNFCEQSQSDL